MVGKGVFVCSWDINLKMILFEFEIEATFAYMLLLISKSVVV